MSAGRGSKTTAVGMGVLLALYACRAAPAAVTALQNAVSPRRGYAGCTDTWISKEPYESALDNAKAPTLRAGGQRRMLIRFDLSPIPKRDRIHQAVLRLADTGYPQKRNGQWPSGLHAYRLTRQWKDNANWFEHTRTNWRRRDEGDWVRHGGDVDLSTDFGRASRGLIAADVLAAGAWGHMHQLDVTEVVRRWHTGKLPNHGLALEASPPSAGCAVAGSEWHVPEYRPKLIVFHTRPAAKPAKPPSLMLAQAAPPADPVSATPDAAKAAGPYGVVRVGQNANCALRGTSTDAYLKDAFARYPGNWGWLNVCRVGGAAGDFNRALLYFDLTGIPPTAAVKRARLVLTLSPGGDRQAGRYRYGAFLVKIFTSLPGWHDNGVTAISRKRGRGHTWREGSLVAASGPGPLAIGKLAAGAGRRLPTMAFDLTGAVRAWVQGKARNCGVAVDNRLEGGAFDFYSSRSFRPQRRPYLELTLSPAPPRPVEPIRVQPAPPPGDYWVAPMRAVHQAFRGGRGTLAQYGDDLTASTAFLAHRFGGDAPHHITPYREQLAPNNTPADVKNELQVIDRHAERQVWWLWKGPRWGNADGKTSDWLLANVAGWQNTMKPEAAVILFGTHDLGKICPAQYAENLALAIRSMLAGGTVPLLTTPPPAAGRAELAQEYRLACLSIAHELSVPVIDYYAEILRRRPNDWDGSTARFSRYQGEQVPTLIGRDGVHPSHPRESQFDFSDDALSRNGYLLRDYLTLRMYYQVIAKVLRPQGG